MNVCGSWHCVIRYLIMITKQDLSLSSFLLFHLSHVSVLQLFRFYMKGIPMPMDLEYVF